MEEKKLEVLYELLERAERENDNRAISALREAIFILEQIRNSWIVLKVLNYLTGEGGRKHNGGYLKLFKYSYFQNI